LRRPLGTETVLTVSIRTLLPQTTYSVAVAYSGFYPDPPSCTTVFTQPLGPFTTAATP
jgi:hypothetical protein